MELGAPKIPPKIHLQYKARFSEESASQASHESPRNFQYTPVFQRSLYSSSTQSRSKANCAGAELAQTTEGIHSFVSRTRGTHLGDQDKHCFRNSKLSDLRDPEKSYCEDAESMARSRSTLNSPHIAITYTSHLEFSDGRYTEDRTLWILVSFRLAFTRPLFLFPGNLLTCVYETGLSLLSLPIAHPCHMYLHRPPDPNPSHPLPALVLHLLRLVLNPYPQISIAPFETSTQPHLLCYRLY